MGKYEQPLMSVAGSHNGRPTRLYEPGYESELMRGVEEPRPWDLQSEIASRVKPGDRILDIGCGTATKILPFASQVGEIIGLEPSEPMRERAEEHIRATGLENVRIVDGSADQLPFEDESFDVVTTILAPDDPDEICRVLKPGGLAIIEKLSEQDKEQLKGFFGADEHGPRGQLSDFRPGGVFNAYVGQYCRRFVSLGMDAGGWDTYYTHEGLVMLLENTPVIRGFDIDKDGDTLEMAESALTTPRGILVPQHRILIIATKSTVSNNHTQHEQ